MLRVKGQMTQLLKRLYSESVGVARTMRELRTVTIGGVGSTTTVEDVVRVANGGRVEFEGGTLEKLKKHVEKEHASTEVTSLDKSNEGNALGEGKLSEGAARASVFVRLATLARGKSGIRPEVLSFHQERLNGELRDWKLAADLHDRSILKSMTGDASEGQLSAAERVLFCSGTCVSAGVGALNLHYGRSLLTIANAVSSLSCEALGASTKMLDPQRLESHANKNAQEVAEVLRTLVAGSKRVNSKKQGVGNVKGICDVPSVHGSVSDALSALQLSLRPELNAQALDFKSLEEIPCDVSLSFFSSLEGACKSLMGVTALSLKRMQYLSDRLPELTLLQETSEVTPTSKERLEEVRSLFVRSLEAAELRFKENRSRASTLSQTDEESLPSAGIALLGNDALSTLSLALALECVLCLVTFMVVEGPATAQVEPHPTANPKKEKKRKGTGLILGQGSAALRRFFQEQLEPKNPMDITHPTDTATVAASWSSFLHTDEQLSNWLSECERMFSMEDGKLQEVTQVIQQQVETHQVQRKPKIPKGARDFLPDQMRIRQKVFDNITAVFKRHGAVSIDTPVFELKETLTGKYGEDSKLIYDLADQGGEILSLRYDLTVPFARYVALNSVGNIKRYHIGKVYRRDQPQMTKGRFREFFQCDFDIAGSYSVMVPDAECVKVLVEVLDDLKLGEFEVKVNHRRLIDAMMDICGVPSAKHRAICSAIDKLDKEPWDVVKAEMVVEKGLDPAVADKLGEFVQLRDTPKSLMQTLTAADHPFMQNTDSAAALKEMGTLIEYLERMEALNGLVFDLSLARGLDYYSGLIYEAIFKGSGTGSVAAGGRYDKLVGMFSGKDVPAVGVSIGVERVFAIMEKQMKEAAQTEGTTIRTNDTQVLVASIGNGLQQRRMEICSLLWSSGINAEFGYKPNPKMGDNFDYALQEGIPFMVLFGEDELKEGVVKIKDLGARTEETVSQSQLVPELLQRLSRL